MMHGRWFSAPQTNIPPSTREHKQVSASEKFSGIRIPDIRLRKKHKKRSYHEMTGRYERLPLLVLPPAAL